MNSIAIIKLERQRNIYSGISVLTILILLISGFQISESLNSGGFLQGLSKFLDFPKKIIDQTVEEGLVAFLSNAISFFPPLIETINIALFSTIVGGVGAVVLSVGAFVGSLLGGVDGCDVVSVGLIVGSFVD